MGLISVRLGEGGKKGKLVAVKVLEHFVQQGHQVSHVFGSNTELFPASNQRRLRCFDLEEKVVLMALFRI